ncbi:MAG TPA: hypothetical protein VFO41_01160 [Alphaproteobacteria bacterium]|nr:hypothetical protein [Alphaproteobacteria bacterium]
MDRHAEGSDQGAAVAVVILGLAAAEQAGAEPIFTSITDLGTLGGTGSRGRNINNAGQMAGWF